MFTYLKKYLLLIFIFLITSCQNNDTETSPWKACFTCTTESWVGDYSGTCEYFDAATNSTTTNLPFNLTIEQTATDYLTAYIQVSNYYSTSISGEFTNPNYISFGGSSSSLSANMYLQGDLFRLTGSSKKYHFKTDSIVIDQVINFESLKQVN